MPAKGLGRTRGNGSESRRVHAAPAVRVSSHVPAAAGKRVGRHAGGRLVVGSGWRAAEGGRHPRTGPPTLPSTRHTLAPRTPAPPPPPHMQQATYARAGHQRQFNLHRATRTHHHWRQQQPGLRRTPGITMHLRIHNHFSAARGSLGIGDQRAGGLWVHHGVPPAALGRDLLVRLLCPLRAHGVAPSHVAWMRVSLARGPVLAHGLAVMAWLGFLARVFTGFFLRAGPRLSQQGQIGSHAAAAPDACMRACVHDAVQGGA
jgi:hypothetical protein